MMRPDPEEQPTDPKPRRASTLTLKDYALAMPATAAATAVVYDVGFFNGIDISLFTFFSLSEHLTFAIQALPVIFILTPFVITFTLLVLDKSAPFPLPDEPLRNKFSPRQRLFVEVGFAALMVLLAVTLDLTTPWFGLLAFVTMGGLQRAKSPRVGYFVAPVMAVFFVFCIGMDFARVTQFSETRHTLTWSDRQLKGSVVRSGERGILFYDPAPKRYRIVAWEGIRTIEIDSTGFEGTLVRKLKDGIVGLFRSVLEAPIVPQTPPAAKTPAQ